MRKSKCDCGDCTPKTCMTLPAGKTCSDCALLNKCKAYFGCKPENTKCDFFPRRFIELSPFDKYWGDKGEKWNGKLDIKNFAKEVWDAAVEFCHKSEPVDDERFFSC